MLSCAKGIFTLRETAWQQIIRGVSRETSQVTNPDEILLFAVKKEHVSSRSRSDILGHII